MHRKQLHRQLSCVFLTFTALFAAFLALGCAVSHTKIIPPTSGVVQPPQTAGKQELITRFNQQAESVKSLNATVAMTLTAGSAYTGVIKQYHEIKGFILARKPASIRVIGQAPVVGTNIFDMVCDGQTFRIFIPSQNKFIVGPANLQRQSSKPIENMRPQHLTGAIFWTPIPGGAHVLIEEENTDASRYYVLSVVRTAGGSAPSGGEASRDWEIAERIWFDRADLNVSRLETYESGGKLASDVSYGAWDASTGAKYPRQILLTRPDSDYKLQIGINKVTFNETIVPDRFVLRQPPGAELIDAGAPQEPSSPEEQPGKQK